MGEWKEDGEVEGDYFLEMKRVKRGDNGDEENNIVMDIVLQLKFVPNSVDNLKDCGKKSLTH